MQTHETSSLVESLRAALGSSQAQIEARDRAMVDLALKYAAEIDGDGDLEKLGPQLQRALEALMMTPRSRLTPAKGGATSDEQPSPLDELRAKRASRAHRAANLDATAT